MKKNNFKEQVEMLCKEHGRKISWVAKKYGLSRFRFWQKINKAEFEVDEKVKIVNIIINGK